MHYGNKKQGTMITREEDRKYSALWEYDADMVGDLTIRDLFQTVESDYLGLSEKLGEYKSILPEEVYAELRVEDVRRASKQISAYYRSKAQGISVDGLLKERVTTPGFKTAQTLLTVPEELLVDLVDEGALYGAGYPLAGEYGIIVEETAKVIQALEESGTVEDATLFPEAPSLETREDYILLDGVSAVCALRLTQRIDREIRGVRDKLSAKLRNKYKGFDKTTEAVLSSQRRTLDQLQTKVSEIDLAGAKKRYELIINLLSALWDLIKEKERDYKIVTVNGQRVVIEYKSYPEDSSVLTELARIAQEPNPGTIPVPKDLMEEQVSSRGDSLILATSETNRARIRDLQKKGKLLQGTLEGLSGGSAYFKVFTIALGMTLNQQSRYYKTDGDGSGVPIERISELMGQEVDTQKLPTVIKLRDEDRRYPYVIISYEDMARKMSSTGKISGGKDAEFINNYINGYQREVVDKRTGKTRTVWTPGIKDREYIIPHGENFVGVRFLVKYGSFYSKDGKEIGCLCGLSPQFSKTARGYSALRSDTIQLLGGGKQKEITMDLIDRLVWVRGIENDYRVNKRKLLEKYRDTPKYKGRPGVLESDFKEAIQKAVDVKIILPGRKGYREERSAGGEVVCVFGLNPDYLKEEGEAE